ncbi:hypothetical protein HBA55_29500 [Pseudomaricurvus alkylphenolicus]|uniref:hypothetical protein n=1 Tax=Pseudomaricurvus alkylphenolicus TaxID=1306991 RepID=UPI001422820D|nr:hypothetical protein [Pseudomaricurvus alkylphenolicus]NIB43774.1 hypothetical protein [Pseudomaricurvus alkylphenolicus]
MQAADQQCQFESTFEHLTLRSPKITQIERDVAVRRCAGKTHPQIAEEFNFTCSNSKKAFARALDKLMPPAGWTDQNPQPRTVAQLASLLLKQGNLIVKTLTSVEVALLLTQIAPIANAIGSTAPLSLTDKH